MDLTRRELELIKAALSKMDTLLTSCLSETDLSEEEKENINGVRNLYLDISKKLLTVLLDPTSFESKEDVSIQPREVVIFFLTRESCPEAEGYQLYVDSLSPNLTKAVEALKTGAYDDSEGPTFGCYKVSHRDIVIVDPYDEENDVDIHAVDLEEAESVSNKDLPKSTVIGFYRIYAD